PASYAHILFLATLCITHSGFSQCPFVITLNSTGHCQGSDLTLTTTVSLTQIVWFRDGAVDTVVTGNPVYKPVEAGSYKAAVSDDAGCTVTTNALLLQASP